MNQTDARNTARRLRETAFSILLAKKEKAPLKEYDETSATKYRSERGRCPRGWRFNKRAQSCQVRRPKAEVPATAPQLANEPEINKVLEALHTESKSSSREPPKPMLRGFDLREFNDNVAPETQKWFDSLSDDEKVAVQDYTLDSYADVNGYLRNKERKAEMDKKFPEYAVPDDPTLVKIAKNVKAALAKASLPEDVTVQRGTINREVATKFKEGNLVGQTVKTDQFYSTTADEMVTKDFVERAASEYEDETPIMWTIGVPKGAKAMALGKVSKYPTEAEILLDEGSELEITGAEMKDGVLHLTANYRSP